MKPGTKQKIQNAANKKEEKQGKRGEIKNCKFMEM